MTPHFWSSCLYLLSSGIIEVSHNALFMWHWGSNSELCTRQVNILPTEMQSQLHFLEGFSLYSRLTSNFKSSCLSFSITGSTGIHHHTHLCKAFFKQLYIAYKEKACCQNKQANKNALAWSQERHIVVSRRNVQGLIHSVYVSAWQIWCQGSAPGVVRMKWESKVRPHCKLSLKRKMSGANISTVTVCPLPPYPQSNLWLGCL